MTVLQIDACHFRMGLNRSIRLPLSWIGGPCPWCLDAAECRWLERATDYPGPIAAMRGEPNTRERRGYGLSHPNLNRGRRFKYALVARHRRPEARNCATLAPVSVRQLALFSPDQNARPDESGRAFTTRVVHGPFCACSACTAIDAAARRYVDPAGF